MEFTPSHSPSDSEASSEASNSDPPQVPSEEGETDSEEGETDNEELADLAAGGFDRAASQLAIGEAVHTALAASDI